MPDTRFPFEDPITGQTVTLCVDDPPGVEHPGCPERADVSPPLDAFFCPACHWNGRISGAWYAEMIRGVASG